LELFVSLRLPLLEAAKKPPEAEFILKKTPQGNVYFRKGNDYFASDKETKIGKWLRFGFAGAFCVLCISQVIACELGSLSVVCEIVASVE
jgi:hypothetical protein